MLRRWLLPLIGLAVLPGAIAWACPFCSAVSMTLSEEIKTADAAIVARLVKLPPLPSEEQQAKGTFIPAEMAKGTFEIVTVLKGPATLKPGQKVEILFFGQQPIDTKFLVVGADPKELAWGTPTELSDKAAKYVAKLPGLPESGPRRLLFFQDYLENKDSLLAADAYDEFAKTPYAEVCQIKDQMRHDKLLEWIKDPETSTSRRRLFLTMLGACGSKHDLKPLENMMQDPQSRAALDALIACYLNLSGPAGMPMVEDLFLKNPKAEYTDTYAAIMALRFHGQETTVVPKERLVEGMRYMLDRPQLADLVIPDLARWQDWSVMGRLVKLFKDATDETAWVRVPVINYLRVCPLPEAKEQIEALKKIDPAAFERASQFIPLGADTPPAGSQRPKKATPADEGGPAPPVSEKLATAPVQSDGQTPAKPGAAEDVAEPAKVEAGTETAAAPAAVADSQTTERPAPKATQDEPKKATAELAINRPGPSRQREEVAAYKTKEAAEPQPNRILTWSLLAAGGVLLLMAAIMRGSRHRELVAKS
ncbi:MAG TPA: hypothetical protein VHY20_04815 [Pirellulales bacterium]|nr:hypothetical protein [Pirellulales bacterium]